MHLTCIKFTKLNPTNIKIPPLAGCLPKYQVY